MPDIGQNHQQALEDARRQDQERQQPSNAREKYNRSFDNDRKRQKNAETANTVKNLAKAVTPMGVFSLLKHANLLKDMPFVCAFGFAILKDILDLVFNETIILGALFSIFCSIFIFMMLLLAGSNGKRKLASGFLKTGLLIGGGVADSLPGLGFLPIETITVFAIYILVLSERANAEK